MDFKRIVQMLIVIIVHALLAFAKVVLKELQLQQSMQSGLLRPKDSLQDLPDEGAGRYRPPA